MRRILLTLTLLGATGLTGLTPLAPPVARADTIDAVLDSLQYTAFRYFWEQANPTNGLIRDRSQSGSPCSIASEGFGLSAICIAIDHGWVSRTDGANRVLTALQTFWNGPQGSATSGTIGYKGFFYHFLDMNTAVRMPVWDPELSSIDTALLLAGILDAKQYFSTVDGTEVQIRSLADSIYRRVDWEFMRNFNPGLEMGWKPGGPGFMNFGLWKGYNEAMIMYLLALGSPTHPNPSSVWTYWTSGYNWGTQYGQTYVLFPPLFGHQYSHCWVDFRSIQDAYMTTKGITYFENSRRATLAQQAYCIANPLGRLGYGANEWGLTAGDGPTGYTARGAPPAQNDDGTITPTAVIGSLPFASGICLPTIQHLYDSYKSQLWGPYGFRDGFNRGVSWWDADVIGIDQGPIIVMIENYRNQSVWKRFMQNSEIQLGLQRAGFTGAAAVGDLPAGAGRPVLWSAPNPFLAATTIGFRLASEGHVRLTVHDVMGREVARLVDEWQPAGQHSVSLAGGGLPDGVYWYRLQASGAVTEVRGVRLR